MSRRTAAVVRDAVTYAARFDVRFNNDAKEILRVGEYLAEQINTYMSAWIYMTVVLAYVKPVRAALAARGVDPDFALEQFRIHIWDEKGKVGTEGRTLLRALRTGSDPLAVFEAQLTLRAASYRRTGCSSLAYLRLQQQQPPQSSPRQQHLSQQHVSPQHVQEEPSASCAEKNGNSARVRDLRSLEKRKAYSDRKVSCGR